MMRSMFSGVSGLRVHQTRMDVIGNNIANVNTVGFKSSRATFQEIFSQTLKGAGAPDSNIGRGGTNPMQVGLGLGLASVDTIMTRGSVQRTDNPTDLAIEGEGFFIVKASKTDTEKFTRAGNFSIDEIGNLNINGMNVMGWQKYTKETKKFEPTDLQPDSIEPINIFFDSHNNDKRTIEAEKTTKAKFLGNLDSKSTSASEFLVPTTVYDKLGNEYKITVKFFNKTSDTDGTTWEWEIGDIVDPKDDQKNILTVGTATGPLSFSKEGKIKDELDGEGQVIDDPKDTATYFPKITLTPDPSIGADPFTVTLDFKSLTMFNGSNSVKPIDVDGYKAGTFVTLNIGSDGLITGIYSNGEQKPIAMLAVANFENPAGLLKAGENMFMASTNSGEYKGGVKPGTNGAGGLNPGTLEMSNVDLSREFTDMIVTQRGFQANSRIITTSDEMLQELVNLKR